MLVNYATDCGFTVSKNPIATGVLADMSMRIRRALYVEDLPLGIIYS